MILDVESWDPPVESGASFSASYTVSTPLIVGATYQWFVDALDGGGYWLGTTATPGTFTVAGDVPPSNRPPVANAGPDQFLETDDPDGVAAVLDGSASYDPDGDPLSYTWTGAYGEVTGSIATVPVPLGVNVVT